MRRNLLAISLTIVMASCQQAPSSGIQDGGPDAVASDTSDGGDLGQDIGPDTEADEEPPTWSSGALLAASNIGPTTLQLDVVEEQLGLPVVDNVAVERILLYQDGLVVQEGTGSTLTFLVDGLAPDTMYDFQVQAEDAAGNRTTAGPTASAVTECATYWEDRCPAWWPADASLAAEVVGDGFLLTWTEALDNRGVKSYRVLVDGLCECIDTGVAETDYTVMGDVTEYTLTGLAQGTSYHIQISARDDVGVECCEGGGWILGPETTITP